MISLTSLPRSHLHIKPPIKQNVYVRQLFSRNAVGTVGCGYLDRGKYMKYGSEFGVYGGAYWQPGTHTPRNIYVLKNVLSFWGEVGVISSFG